MSEALLDIKTFSGLNFSPALHAGECQQCCNLDDENAPALRSARTFETVSVPGDGTFMGAWIENGEVLAYVRNNVLYAGETWYPLTALNTARRFLRISPEQILIQPDMYLYEPARSRCYPYDNRFTAKADVSTASGVVTVTLQSVPPVYFTGAVYVDGLSLVYYDEETAPTAPLLYFAVTTAETLLGNRFRMTLTPVYSTGTGYLPNLSAEGQTLTVRRALPELSHAMMFKNRLWGVSGKKLLGSKLGTPFLFTAFAGLSTDSYELAFEEPLTAVAHFGERLVVFSKTSLYELYGDRPSNYQISAAKPGGCAHPFSICNAGGYLIYADGMRVYRYGGGDPKEVTDRLGFPDWSDVFGLSDGETCLLGMNTDGWRLYRFRPSRDAFFELPFAACGGCVADGRCYFFLDGALYGAAKARSDADFCYRSGWLCLDRLGTRAPRELHVRIDGTVDRFALITRDGSDHPLTAVDDRGDGLYRLPFPADLCNRVFAVDIRGRGDACLHRITVRG